MQVMKWTAMLGVICAVGCVFGQDKPAVKAPDAAPRIEVPDGPVPVPKAGDAIYAPLATGDGAESLGKRFDAYKVITFGPRALIAPLFSAGIAMARPNKYYPREWKDGAAAFGRHYGSSLGTKVAAQTARFAVGAALHEDYRYRPATVTGFLPRTGHAIGYAFVDRGDSGHRRLALANFAEAGAGGFAGNLWLPDGFNDAQHGATRTGARFGGIVGSYIGREFSPEIEAFVKKLHLPFPRVPGGGWWTKN